MFFDGIKTAVEKRNNLSERILRTFMVYFMMADGFEEAEALVPFDILTRCGLSCKLVSFASTEVVTGAHSVKVVCDMMLSDLDLSKVECVIFPGGGKGTENLDSEPLTNRILEVVFSKGVLVGAICAAPSILGKRGYLKGFNATCYPGFEQYLNDANVMNERVVCCKNVITAKGAGAAYEFAYAIASKLKDPQTAQNVKEKIY